MESLPPAFEYTFLVFFLTPTNIYCELAFHVYALLNITIQTKTHNSAPNTGTPPKINDPNAAAHFFFTNFLNIVFLVVIKNSPKHDLTQALSSHVVVSLV